MNLGAREIAGDQKDHRRRDRRRDVGDRNAQTPCNKPATIVSDHSRASEMTARMSTSEQRNAPDPEPTVHSSRVSSHSRNGNRSQPAPTATAARLDRRNAHYRRRQQFKFVAVKHNVQLPRHVRKWHTSANPPRGTNDGSSTVLRRLARGVNTAASRNDRPICERNDRLLSTATVDNKARSNWASWLILASWRDP